MQKQTKTKLSAYVKAVAAQNDVDDATEKFNVSPNGTQRIIAAIRESSWFLNKINIISVKNQKGESIGLGVTGMIASRTDTSGSGKRTPKDHSSMGAMPYMCEQTNFDTALRYAKLDAWAHHKNFNALISKVTREQIDANKITIGWYGVSVAKNTDASANPNGEDVNKGWFQAMRDHNAERLITTGQKADGEIRIGEGGDFINLDLAVLETKNLLHDACENDSNLVAIIGSDLLAYDKAKFYEAHGNTPSEKGKIQELQVIGTYGGLPAVKVPGFPSTGIMVTSYDNLSIYIQEGSVRRSTGKKNDEKDQIENFESMNMAYVIEEIGKAAAIEFKNVKLWINEAWH
ncbi:phage major capsid protein, P2 family [Vibrio crassostreae]|uniref:phage major capsid protein, P2 family n=1 Tax=Vibrio crassostreae TaxID=246167 RepID=UPI001B3014DF|nr:phage major capsid protein, P2 family [Vibrio crassostreae]CAK2384475.1 Phage major capsid protein, P2 family [Vibrio crassostreae]CAK2444997.1 Phage major capsid protein, P2 family [Vibrio crassostreae]CAK2555277.1 Phage major capsid protein, P2 family [Vibrio crassostreae]CAK2561565.1 Phage major capsid protein, P2 family [Vibrio crassostreae]CAK2810092.1 Phage major capsid protein, P2 family [Vibrio crassostreae]